MALFVSAPRLEGLLIHLPACPEARVGGAGKAKVSSVDEVEGNGGKGFLPIGFLAVRSILRTPDLEEFG